jgi:hypothetical protein
MTPLTTPPAAPRALRPVVPRLTHGVLYDYHGVLEYLLAGGYMTNVGEFSLEDSTGHPPIDPARVDPDLAYAVIAAVLTPPNAQDLGVVLESLRMAALALDAGWQAVVNELEED